MRFGFLMMFLVSRLFCLSGNIEAADNQKPAKLSKAVTIEMDFLISLPDDYESKKKWPLILFLHGAGERGDDLELVKFHGPPKLISNGQKFPFIVVSPQCPKEEWWHLKVDTLNMLLDEIEDKYNVDSERIYVTGLSMGGFGTWSLATRSPHRFAAIAPICGGGDRQFAKRLKHLPAWVFHGAKDTGVPPIRSTEMVDALKAAGGTPKLTIYPEAKHDSWTATYDNPKLYEWFLQHKRIPPEPKK